MRMSFFLVLMGSAIGLGLTRAPRAATQQSDDVIALERAALDKWSKGDPSGFLANYADDITYFDPMREARVDGLPAIRELLAPIAGKFSIDRYEILNPKVQRSGNAAVLSYNLANYKKLPNGTEQQINRWNSTSVFFREGGRWREVHSHWSFTKPELKMPPAP